MKGRYKAKAVIAESGLRTSSQKGTPKFFILFEIVEGDDKGKTVPWDGWLTPDAEQRTYDSLSYCGWDGKTLLKDAAPQLTGIASIDVEEEKYAVDVKNEKGDVIGKEERTRTRVQWVNDSHRAFAHKPMDETTATAFSERMQGGIEAWRQKRGSKSASGDGDRFDFGANAPANGPAEPAKQTPSAEAQQPTAKTGF